MVTIKKATKKQIKENTERLQRGINNKFKRHAERKGTGD